MSTKKSELLATANEYILHIETKRKEIAKLFENLIESSNNDIAIAALAKAISVRFGTLKVTVSIWRGQSAIYAEPAFAEKDPKELNVDQLQQLCERLSIVAKDAHYWPHPDALFGFSKGYWAGLDAQNEKIKELERKLRDAERNDGPIGLFPFPPMMRRW